MYVVAASIGSVLLISGGIYIVSARSPVSSVAQEGTWGSGVALPPPGSTTPADTSRETLMQQVQDNAPFTYIAGITLPAPASQTTNDSSTADLQALLAAITATSSAKGSASAPLDLSGAYAYIPGGLVAPQNNTAKRTPTQEALYEYGNSVGSLIQSFELDHQNMSQVLTDEANDRTDATKVQKLAALGTDLMHLGNAMLQEDSVPPQATELHAALAGSYVEIGGKLVAVSKMQRDSDFLAAVQAYDASADKFIQKYVALAQLFGSYGVQFASSDPGSVFSFSSASGL